jgi:cell division protease FtsH
MGKTELLNKIATLLGGRAAEEIVFDEISTGAHNDLARATDIARSMVKEYGMSEKIGQVYFAQGQRSKFMNIMPEGQENYSQATAELIDQEVRDIITTQYAAARDILRDKRDILDEAAQALLEKEVIGGDELKKLMDKVGVGV